MAQVKIQEQQLINTANVLRQKLQVEDTWLPSELPMAIQSGDLWGWVKDDGSHYFHLIIDEKWQLTQALNLKLTGTIDWGDGTSTSCSHSAVTQELHTYNTYGAYIIHVTNTGNTTMTWGANNFNSNERARLAVKYYELGTNWTYETNAFANLELVKCIFFHLEDTSKGTNGAVLNLAASWGGYTSLNYIKSPNPIVMTSSVTTYFPQLIGFDCPSITANGVIYYLDFADRCLNPFVPNKGSYKRVISSTSAITSNMTIDELHMLPTTPPSLSGTISFVDNKSKIYVPATALATYQSATNWANYAARMIGE